MFEEKPCARFEQLWPRCTHLIIDRRSGHPRFRIFVSSAVNPFLDTSPVSLLVSVFMRLTHHQKILKKFKIETRAQKKPQEKQKKHKKNNKKTPNNNKKHNAVPY